MLNEALEEYIQEILEYKETNDFEIVNIICYRDITINTNYIFAIVRQFTSQQHYEVIIEDIGEVKSDKYFYLISELSDFDAYNRMYNNLKQRQFDNNKKI